MKQLLIVLEMIKFEHTIFALPFALLGAILAAHGLPAWDKLFWIVVAMVGARSAAMAFNRLVDHRFDALNPRTSGRALPRGLVTRSFVRLFIVLSSAVFVLAARMLNDLAFYLSPLALAIVLLYSFTKRFTVWSHLALGLALAISPVGGWVAVRGTLETTPYILGAIVLFWSTGFDIIYACQDTDFDRRHRLFSLPTRLGIGGALRVSMVLHLLMVVFLILLIARYGLSLFSWLGLLVVVAGLAYEHSLVKPSDLSRVNAAFFTVNGLISVFLLLFIGLDICLFV